MILTETKISNSNLQQLYIFHSALLLYLHLECVCSTCMLNSMN